MTEEEHKQIHVDLHNSLDMLVADFIAHSKKLPSKTTLIEFMEWSHLQSLNPTGDTNAT